MQIPRLWFRAVVLALPLFMAVLLWLASHYCPRPVPQITIGVTQARGAYWNEGKLTFLRVGDGIQGAWFPLQTWNSRLHDYSYWTAASWTGERLQLSIPALVMLATLPLVAAAAYRGWHRYLESLRIPEGHCQSCGYDLRATPSRCPECGTAPSMAAVLPII